MPLSKRIIRVPVKLIDGHWELLYGGPVKVNEGAVGELHIDRVFFTDAQFLEALTSKREILALAAGTELRVALTIKDLDTELRRTLLDGLQTPHVRTARIGPHTRFVAVTLSGPTEAQRAADVKVGGLWLRLEGMEARGIHSGMVELPKTDKLKQAESLNHAFTQLSEVFEPWRQAHTGSIYERVFYEESNGLWYPLNDLRKRALAVAERTVITELWTNVAKELGLSWL